MSNVYRHARGCNRKQIYLLPEANTCKWRQRFRVRFTKWRDIFNQSQIKAKKLRNSRWKPRDSGIQWNGFHLVSRVSLPENFVKAREGPFKRFQHLPNIRWTDIAQILDERSVQTVSTRFNIFKTDKENVESMLNKV